MSYDKNFSALGKNIRGLRKAFGETQLDLAISIGASGPNVISQYESGERVPEREFLFRIAKHYRITEEELLNRDFEHTKSLTNCPVGDIKIGIEILEKMFPLICTEQALENPKFSEAYRIHTDFLAKMMADSDIEEGCIDRCLDLYKKARQDGLAEAAANHLWWLMFVGFAFSVLTPRLMEIYDMADISELTAKEFFRGYLPSFDEADSESEFDTESNRREFLKENEIDLIVDIILLRKSKEFSDLGDYYLALRHKFSLLRNTLSTEMNSAVGDELLLTFSLMGNKYCDNFSSILQIFGEDQK